MCKKREEEVWSRSKGSSPGTAMEKERNMKYQTDTTGASSENRRRAEVQASSRVPTGHLVDCNACACCLALRLATLREDFRATGRIRPKVSTTAQNSSLISSQFVARPMIPVMRPSASVRADGS